MSHSLPVIVGFGGYNAAGRSSSHQAFRRMVLESLPAEEQRKTIVGLACLMGHVKNGKKIGFMLVLRIVLILRKSMCICIKNIVEIK